MGLFIFDKNGVVEVTGDKSSIELDLQIQNRDLPESEKRILWEGEVPDRMFYENGVLTEKYFLDLARLGYKSLSEVKEWAIDKADRETNQLLLSGFTSSALGSPHTYGSDEEDQRNLIACVASGEGCPYKCVDSNGIADFRPHTITQLKTVLREGRDIVIQKRTEFMNIKNSIMTAATNEEVLSAIGL